MSRRGRTLGRWGAMVLFASAAGCGSRGQVTFVLHDAEDARMRPDPTLVSEYLIRAGDGSVVGIVSQDANSPTLLPLGALTASSMPRDMVLAELNGSQLLGMARLRDVAVLAGQQNSYDVEVRKPLQFIGFGKPLEPAGRLVPNATKILDPTTSNDLTRPPSGPPVTISGDIGAGAVTSDGRFFLGGRPSALQVFDTGRATSLGEARLAFEPLAVMVAPRDGAVAVLSSAPTGDVLLFTDEGALLARPGAATPAATRQLGEPVRAAVFSADGQRLYVLTGDPNVLDACDGAAQPANAIHVLGLDGQEQASWQLPSFAAALAVDPGSGAVLVSLAANVSSIPPQSATGPVSPQPLFPATCPAALQVVNGQLLVVTGALHPGSSGDVGLSGTFDLLSAPVAGGALTTHPLPTPVFEQAQGMSGTNFDQVIRVLPSRLSGYSLAVTPDGARAVFGTRAHYLVLNAVIFNDNRSGITCTATFDAVEYDLYNVDLRSGAASFERRALLKTGTCNTSCSDALSTQTAPCLPLSLYPGDRPAAIAGVFGSP